MRAEVLSVIVAKLISNPLCRSYFVDRAIDGILSRAVRVRARDRKLYGFNVLRNLV